MAKIEFDRNAQIIIIPVAIIGKQGLPTKTLQMVLDTGSTYTIIRWSNALSAGLNPTTSTERVRIITGSGIEYAPKVMAYQLSALGESLNTVELVCHDLPPESKVDGVLGLSFLSKFDLTISYQTGTLTLTPITK